MGDAEALYALHGPLGSNDFSPADAAPTTRATSATELLQAVHFVPFAYRGSKWKGLIRLNVSRLFSIGVFVDGEAARVSFKLESQNSVEAFLVLEAGRDVILSMLEGSATPCMLVVS